MATKFFWDRAGITLSGLCVVHCLVFPLLLALLPVYSVLETVHYWAHPVLLILILPVVFSVVRRSETPAIARFFLVSGALALIGAWGLHDWQEGAAETYLTLAASALLITGHWKNYKSHRIRKISRSHQS